MTNASLPLHRTALIAIALLAATLAAALIARAEPATGLAASQLGDKGKVPKSSCPAPGGVAGTDFPGYKACNAFGHVTGFQISADGQQPVFKAPEAGKVVAWSVDTTVPKDDPYRNFFEKNLADETFDKFGGDPSAGISILKELGKGRFKLAKKSPIVNLDDSLGRNPIITLKKPLKIQKGRIVALTTPTWVTNLAIANPRGKGFLSDEYRWRASRKPSKCETSGDDNSNLTSESHPQVKRGSKVRYGCSYNAEINYRAYYVPDK